MARRRPKILNTRRFAFFIGAAIILIILLINSFSGLLDDIELKIMDTHFFLKEGFSNVIFQEGAITSDYNPKKSQDILIIGIDQTTLSKYGHWPFPRWRHADLLNTFSRIKDQENRENSIFLDIFFSDPGIAADDAILLQGIQESNRVFLENIMLSNLPNLSTAEDFMVRHNYIKEKFGTLNNIKGDWQSVKDYLSVESPLIPYSQFIKGYGHATYEPDKDKIFRRQPLVAKLASLKEIIRLDDLTPGFDVDNNYFERLTWMDKNGVFHNIETPLTEKNLAKLKKVMIKNAPVKVEDLDNDGNPEDQYYIVRLFQDSFLPSVTLSLALEYFGKTFDEISVEFGKHIIIPSPAVFDPDRGERVPYQIVLKPEEYDESGNIITPQKTRILNNITIPIDQNGCMLINFLGNPSDSSPGGEQTFTVRPYSGYASKAPGPDTSTWPRTMNVMNKILMVGAFSSGMAQDEKPTPFGLMYGIEIHANSLNTIIMNNFLIIVPFWIEILILCAFVFLVCFFSSRLSAISSLFITLGLLLILFLLITMSFDYLNLSFNFINPALGIFTCFVAVVVYRAFTDERDKRAIRETFGKYVSPSVVDQLVDNPPELGGLDKELTVFFSDIRGFTTLSENLSPQELVNHLNSYLSAMTNLVLEYGGTLDKYIGDAIMCFWGAPLPQEDHAVRACKCALRQMKKLEELNKSWPEPLRLNIGIGINSGIMTVGNMGSPIRMNYTLTGDNVNLGSRLEATNKEYSTQIIVSETTYGLVKDKFILRELDSIRVKGKNKPVGIYELIDCIEDLDLPINNDL